VPSVVNSPHFGHFVTFVPKTFPQFLHTAFSHSGHFVTPSGKDAPQFPQVRSLFLLSTFSFTKSSKKSSEDLSLIISSLM